jgi:hypothetical protein
LVECGKRTKNDTASKDSQETNANETTKGSSQVLKMNNNIETIKDNDSSIGSLEIKANETIKDNVSSNGSQEIIVNETDNESDKVKPENIRITALKIGAKRTSTDALNEEHDSSAKHSRA